MSNVSKLQRKINNSSQFAQVAKFIGEITDAAGLITVTNYNYLAVCPWTDKRLDAKLANINTTLFCQLFSMKPTSCERYLRWYKENHKA